MAGTRSVLALFSHARQLAGPLKTEELLRVTGTHPINVVGMPRLGLVVVGACGDRGGTFSRNHFLNDGAP